MAVIDATVIAEYLGDAAHAEVARREMLAHRPSLWAPHLIDAEVGHALRGGVRRRELDAAAAADALEELVAMPLRRVKHRKLVARAWELRDNLSFYDALYVALAEILDQPLLTFDRGIARASGVRARVEVLA